MSVTNKIMTPMTSECEACTRSYTYLLILHISLVFAFLVGHPSTCFSKSCPYRNAVFTSVELSDHFLCNKTYMHLT